MSGSFPPAVNRESGFAIFVIPVAFLIMAFFMTVVIQEGETKPIYAEVKTQQQMEVVEKAVAAFSHRNYRVPCPADPSVDPAVSPDTFGAERWDAGNGVPDCDTNQEGIVPFKTLGLTEFDVKDEWGNYYTYAVSPGFTKVIRTVDFNRVDPAKYDGGAPAAGEELITPYQPGDSLPAGLDLADTYVHDFCRQADDWIELGATVHYGPDGAEYIFDNCIGPGCNASDVCVAPDPSKGGRV